MAFLGSFDISASGMSAQRMRMDIAAENITNIDTTRTEGGGAYRRILFFPQAAEKIYLLYIRRGHDYGRACGDEVSSWNRKNKYIKRSID